MQDIEGVLIPYTEFLTKYGYTVNDYEKSRDSGLFVEQMLNGEKYVKITKRLLEETRAIFIQNPKQMSSAWFEDLLCSEYESYNDFLLELLKTHVSVLTLTDGKVDFCTEVYKYLTKE